MRTRAHFTHIQDSTQQDWQIIAAQSRHDSLGLTERVISHLQMLEGNFGGYPIDRYEHSLQTATRALRAGRDEEYVCCALLHDIGETLGGLNHAEIAATILKPYVSFDNLWMVQHHDIFQGYYFLHHLGMDRNRREQFRGHSNFERTVEFCELYDNPSYDAHAETFPVVEFEPMLRRLFAVPKQILGKAELTE